MIMCVFSIGRPSPFMAFSMVRLRTWVNTMRSTSESATFSCSARRCTIAGQPTSFTSGGYFSTMRTFVRPSRTDASLAGSAVPPL